jgi:SAM-dependent methyltransferase
MRRPVDPRHDAFGQALYDHLEGRGGLELVERSDGHIDVSAGAEVYFAQPTGLQGLVVDRANGRVLDIGCGAGRYALYLQERGRDVVGIDASPLAVEVCRRRGLRDVRLLTLEQVDDSLGRFDTILMLGNNFGLLGSFRGARRILKRLGKLVVSGGSIIAETLDPYQTSDPSHLAYHAQNRGRGRMGGQIRMRVRYQAYRTPWFDYLFVSRDELDDIVTDTVWRVREVIESHGANYVVVLERSRSSAADPEGSR